MHSRIKLVPRKRARRRVSCAGPCTPGLCPECIKKRDLTNKLVLDWLLLNQRPEPPANDPTPSPAL